MKGETVMIKTKIFKILVHFDFDNKKPLEFLHPLASIVA